MLNNYSGPEMLLLKAAAMERPRTLFCPAALDEGRRDTCRSLTWQYALNASRANAYLNQDYEENLSHPEICTAL